MRIYVASKYEEKERSSEVAALLEQAGHSITYKWWFNEQVSEEQAYADFNGVMAADALVLIAERDLNYCGALVELGMALAAGLDVCVLGTALDERCIFLQIGEPYITRGIDALLPTPAGP